MKYVVAVLHFVLAPLSDSHGGKLSITRILCVAFAVLLWHAIAKQWAISVTHLTFALAILAAAFGKSTYSFFLSKDKSGATPQ